MIKIIKCSKIDTTQSFYSLWMNSYMRAGAVCCRSTCIFHWLTLQPQFKDSKAVSKARKQLWHGLYEVLRSPNPLDVFYNRPHTRQQYTTSHSSHSALLLLKWKWHKMTFEDSLLETSYVMCRCLQTLTFRSSVDLCLCCFFFSVLEVGMGAALHKGMLSDSSDSERCRWLGVSLRCVTSAAPEKVLDSVCDEQARKRERGFPLALQS